VPAPISAFLRENGLSLVAGALFGACLIGQVLTGFSVYNDTLGEHGAAPVSFVGYLQSGHFLEATFENWESEFLQMALFVALTVMLRQKGSSESKALDEPEAVDEDPRLHRGDHDAPWPVRRGGWILRAYEHSLSFALFLLFSACFVLHAWGGLLELNAERALHLEPAQTLMGYIGSAEFWFQSFQNWQSEFLAVLAIVLLSVVLRERGSPQSKPVAAAHGETGE
jgi:hypothetical protein